MSYVTFSNILSHFVSKILSILYFFKEESFMRRSTSF